MRDGEINLEKSHEWFGKFWFVDSVDNKKEFSGKIEYSQEKGIRVSLVSTFDNKESYSKKIVHGLISSQSNPVPITLFHVFLNVDTISHAATFTGSAGIMVMSAHLESQDFEKLVIRYDDHFENCFLMPTKKQRDALGFQKSGSISAGNSLKISSQINGWSTFMSENDIDVIFSSRSEGGVDRLKDVMRPLFSDKSFSLDRRLETNFEIAFQNDKSNIWQLLDYEHNWRLYWELLIDHPIHVVCAFILTVRDNGDGHKYTTRLPCLFKQKNQHKHRNRPLNYHSLPINFSAFTSSAYNFQILEGPIRKWMDSLQLEDWQTIFDGVRRFIGTNDNLADSTKYLMLIADVETFLDLLGEKNTNVDRLIELYGYQAWEQSLRDLSINIAPNETLGEWFSDVRNVIAHPKSCSKKAGGKYRAVFSQPLLLHNVYAHLAALLMNGILCYMGGLERNTLEKYTNYVIRYRCTYELDDWE